MIVFVQRIAEGFGHPTERTGLFNEFQFLGVKLGNHAVYPRFLKYDLDLRHPGLNELHTLSFIFYQKKRKQ